MTVLVGFIIVAVFLWIVFAIFGFIGREIAMCIVITAKLIQLLYRFLRWFCRSTVQLVRSFKG